MKKKKPSKKKISIDLHMYGIFDNKKKTVTKISLEQSDIQMEIALMGGLKEHLEECEFDIRLNV